MGGYLVKIQIIEFLYTMYEPSNNIENKKTPNFRNNR